MIGFKICRRTETIASSDSKSRAYRSMKRILPNYFATGRSCWEIYIKLGTPQFKNDTDILE